MNTNGAAWMAMSAALILAVGRAAAAGESWWAFEQPELKEALERAPVLQAESLGEPARGVNVWERWLVPNLDGKSWDVLQIYFKEYYGPTWLYAIDLGTGQVRKQRLADGHQFYLSGRALGFDGKYYIATPSRKTWSMDLFVYDPATNTVEERGEIVPGLGGEVRPLVTGPDGRIYGTGTRDNRVGLYIYDPKLGNVVKDFGPVGPSHPNGAWSRYVMGVDDTHAYIASGMIPAWYLVAVNLTTGEEKVLLESPTECVMDLIESFPGAYARVPQDGGAPDKEYWLYHGQGIPKTNDTPPWPKQASPWDKAGPKPDVYFEQIDPDVEGNATLWYRSADDGGWRSIRLEGVGSYPHRINPMSLLPDGRLYGTGDDYAGVFVYDVSEQKIVREIVPVPKARTTGLIAEVRSGRLLGLTSGPEWSGRSVLHGVDVTTSQVLFTKDLPSPVSVDDYWPHWVDPSYEYNAFARGPDGFVWTNHITPATYAADRVEFSRRMKAEDPAIQIGASGDTDAWWQAVLAHAAYCISPEQGYDYPRGSRDPPKPVRRIHTRRAVGIPWKRAIGSASGLDGRWLAARRAELVPQDDCDPPLRTRAQVVA